MSTVNPSEFNTWFVKEILVHERALRGYLSRFFRNVSDVEDVVQETYARLLSLNPTATGHSAQLARLSVYERP